MARRFALVTVVVAMLGVGARLAEQARPEVAMSAAAQRLLSALDDAGRKRIQFAFDSDERFNWHFIPRERKGLPLKDMTESQRAAAMELLRTGLGAAGVDKAEGIRRLELVLRAMEKRDSRDPEMYFFTIFGDPAGANWAWRYEGHHLSQNWTISRGKAVASSPAFFGANPAEVETGDMKGFRALPQEADLAWVLMEKMSGAERASVLQPGAAPNDILTAASRKATPLESVGLLVKDMSQNTRTLFMRLLEYHANSQHPAVAAERMARVRAAGLDAIRFAWIGATTRAPRAAHYYRIQGPTFLIEYDNTQNGANHQHIVWRDFNGDFGADLLAEHYAQAHGGTGLISTGFHK
jgi:hypothetical protein